MNNLVIAVIGHRNAGKSTTWYTLFDRKVKTGDSLRPLNLNDAEYVDVFLINGSPEERGIYVGEIIGEPPLPRIVLCSMQYIEQVKHSIDYFIDNDYLIYAQWLNPGKHDIDCVSYDSLGLMNYLLSRKSVTSIRNGKENSASRCDEIRAFLYGWAMSNGLLKRR